ncbi:MAG TPA: hypothetical protein VGD79_13915 [Thermoanaerobaculia bacterium]
MRKTTALVLISVLLFTGCATMKQPPVLTQKPSNVKDWMASQSRARKRAMVGALIGAAIGATAASLSGLSHDQILGHAVAGGFVGAMVGFALGKRQDQILAPRNIAVRQIGYDPSQGYVARVEKVTFEPAQPKPGQSATLYIRYVVLGPDPYERIDVQLFRGIKYNDTYIFGAGPNEFVVPNGGGVVESTVSVTFPEKAPTGTYSIEALLEDPQGRFGQVVGTGQLYLVARAATGGRIAVAG